MRRAKSDIPAQAVETVVDFFRKIATSKNSWSVQLGKSECVLDGLVVGYRYYEENGRLAKETPIKDGKIHGRTYEWKEDGTLHLMEPYCNGIPHGVAKQYEGDRVIGIYKLIHGTGYDIWRSCNKSGSVFIEEIHSMKDGFRHGFEWWLNHDRTIWCETHWRKGKRHGIERTWRKGRGMHRGYPKYWINDNVVKRSQYLAECRKDNTLPPYKTSDNVPRRKFPALLERIIKSKRKVKGLKL